jgi:FimV-like protein
MTALPSTKWLTAPIWSSLAWLWLLSLPCQALTLGDLAVSSFTAPSFNASLAFSDDNLLRLPELQTRVATDVEYAQWGMQAPSFVHELRTRISPASTTVGYIELHSLTPVPQDTFDLLIWASHPGHTVLTHFKVALMDMPSLIKGRVLQTSMPTASIFHGRLLTPGGLRQTTPAPAIEKARNAFVASPMRAAEIPPLSSSAAVAPKTSDLPLATPASFQRPQTLTTATPVDPVSQKRTSSNDASGVIGLVIVFALVLFLLGFLLGRGRPSSSKVRMPSAPASKTQSRPMVSFGAAKPGSRSQQRPMSVPTPRRRSGQQPAPAFTRMTPLPVFMPLATPVPAVDPSTVVPATATASPSENSQVHTPSPPLSAMPPSPVTEKSTIAASVAPQKATPQESLSTMEVAELALVPATSAPINPVASVTIVARPPATALPTPGLSANKGRATKAHQTKSAGNANIDLAKIYLSMGDPATAQMVLQEVMQQGTEAEKTIAEQLMHEMA